MELQKIAPLALILVQGSLIYLFKVQASLRVVLESIEISDFARVFLKIALNF